MAFHPRTIPQVQIVKTIIQIALLLMLDPDLDRVASYSVLW